MNRTKLYVSAALFLFITIFKLAVPTAASDLREKILPAISHNTDYTQALNDLGAHLVVNRESVPELVELADTHPLQEPVVRPLTEHIKVYYPQVYAEFTSCAKSDSTQESTESVEPEETEMPDVVAAFLEAQEPYSCYSIPETVSYELAELPFAFTSPVEGMTSSGFGYRVHPIFNEVKFHYGTDFSAWTGTSIQAFADGFVQAAGNSDSYGLYLILNHGNGWTTLYAHCSQLCVTEGSAVTMGQQIALAGETGQATGPHLHFELMCNNIYFNPEFYINA